MTEQALGQETLQLIDALQQQGVTTYLAFMRHSARHLDINVPDSEQGLTEAGKQAAYDFGRALGAQNPIRFFSSPATRCVETALLIEKGCLSRGQETQTNRVKDYLFGGSFVKDGPKVGQMVLKIIDAGEYPNTFIRNWFDGKISTDIMAEASQSASSLLKALLDLLQETTTSGNICISHDWHLYLLKEYYLGLRVEETGPIAYLEGVIIYKWHADYCITHHQSDAKLLKIP